MKQNNGDLILGWDKTVLDTFEVLIHRKLQRNVQGGSMHCSPGFPQRHLRNTGHSQNWKADTGAITELLRSVQLYMHSFVCVCACKQFCATAHAHAHLQLYATTAKNQNGLIVPPPRAPSCYPFYFLIATPLSLSNPLI